MRRWSACPYPGFRSVRLDRCIVPCPSFLFCALITVCLTYMLVPVGSQPGLPEFYATSLPACHGLWTPADHYTLALVGVSVLPSGAIKPSASAKTKSRSCTSSSGCATTPAAYRILCLRFARLVHTSICSVTDARLDTGGWLTLARRGLTPRKMRRALLGAKWHLLELIPVVSGENVGGMDAPPSSLQGRIHGVLRTK